jgi:hypothetical protein
LSVLERGALRRSLMSVVVGCIRIRLLKKLLVTLADARACLTRYRSTVTYSPGVARGTERAIKLVMKAAETGAYPDRKAATDQVEIVLRWRAVY